MAGDHGVGLWWWSIKGTVDCDDVCAVVLMHGHQMPGLHDLGHAAAVAAHVFGSVIRPQAAIQAGIDAPGHPALTGKEGVFDAGQGLKCGR